MVQTADGSPEEGAGRQDDDMSNPMWVHIIRLLDDEEQATMVLQIFKQAMITRAIETDLSARDSRRRKWGHAYDDERAPTGEVYGYDKGAATGAAGGAGGRAA